MLKVSEYLALKYILIVCLTIVSKILKQYVHILWPGSRLIMLLASCARSN